MGNVQMNYTEKKIKSQIKNQFPKIKNLISLKSMKHKEINSNTWKIITNKEKFVFHKNHFDHKKRIEAMCEILFEISKKNHLVLTPIRTINKDFCIKNQYITKYVKGSFFSGDEEEFMKLANNLRVLHKSLKPYSKNFNFKPNQKKYFLLDKNELHRIELKISNKKMSTIDELIKKEIFFIKNEIEKNMRYKIIKNYKKQLIHYDLQPDNILFFKKNVQVFLDFNSMRNGKIIEDVIFCSFRFAIKMNKSNKQTLELILNFLHNYDKSLVYEKSDLSYFLSKLILSRICFILREYYFKNSNSWILDLENQIKYLKSVKKIFSN